MALHTLVFDREQGDDVIFRCSVCTREIGFNKPGIGRPAAIFNGGIWSPPANPDQWMEPCEHAEREALAIELESGRKVALTPEDAALLARALRSR